MEYESFLQKLRSEIEKSSMTQVKIARTLGIKNTQLNTQLHDTTKLYVATLFRISEIIGIKVENLFNENTLPSQVNERQENYNTNYNSNILADQLIFMRELIRDQIQIIKNLSNEKGNFNADADSNNNSN